jgi:MFS family permease
MVTGYGARVPGGRREVPLRYSGPVTSLFRLGPFGAFRELRHEFDRAVLVLAVGDLVASFGFSLVFPFLTIYLTTVVGATATQSGLVLGLYSITSIGSNAAGGWLADRFGRRRVMIGSIALTSLVIMAMGQARDLTGVAVLTLALGIVDPAFVPAARAAVADVVPEQRRPRAYGLLGVAASVGWIAGPSIGAGLATFGYPLLFTISGAVLLAYTAILVVALPETRPVPLPPATEDSGHPVDVVHGAVLHEGLGALDPHHAPGGTTGRRRPGLAPLDGSGPDGSARQGPGLRGARAQFLAFLAIAVVIHATTFQWVATLPIHATRDLGVSTSTWGLLFALNGILIVMFQLRVTTLSERWAKPATMAAGMGAYALAYLAVGAAGIPGLATVALAGVVMLATTGEMLVFPVEPAYVSDLSPVSLRGRYQGAFGAAAGLGSGIGPPLGGLALDVLPDPLPWVLVAAGGLVSAAALLWLSRRARRGIAPLVPAGAAG